MIPLAVGVLTGVAVTALGGAALIAHEARRETRLARRRVLAEHSLAEQDGRGRPRLLIAARRLGELATAGRTSSGLREDLARAGYHSPAAATAYVGTKLLLLAAGVALTSAAVLSLELSAGMTLLWIAVGSGLFFLAPNLVVASARRRRTAAIERHLPDAVDLLEICVGSGLGLDQAWNSVADEVRRVSPVLADEMELCTLETSLGVPRPVAMRHMAERTGAQEISSLVALLVQSERFGASIVDALATFAQSMRESRSQRAEEAAEKMSVKLLFPLVMFIFPALLIVMVGPALLDLVRVLGGS